MKLPIATLAARAGLAALVLAMAGQAAAAEQVIDVGGTEVTLPDPPGFALVTPEMSALYATLESLTPDDHVRYAAYIPEELAAGAREGVAQDYLTLITVQDIVGVGDRTLSTEEFARVKDSVKAANAEILLDITGASGDGGEDQDPHIPSALLSADYVPLPAHAETDRSVAYIAFMPTSAAGSEQARGSRRMAAAMTLVHARSKALLLNVGAMESELVWAQDFAAAWAEAILAANAE